MTNNEVTVSDLLDAEVKLNEVKEELNVGEALALIDIIDNTVVELDVIIDKYTGTSQSKPLSIIQASNFKQNCLMTKQGLQFIVDGPASPAPMPGMPLIAPDTGIA
jgi:hypothetical protein